MENKTRTVFWFTVALPAVIAAVVVVCIVNFRSGAWGRDTILAAFADSRGLPANLAQLDDLFRQQMPSGNIWIEFKGFIPERSSDKLFMELVYYRGNYTIYPRHAYLSLPSTVLNNCQNIDRRHVVIDRTIIEKLGIQWMVTFIRDKQGQHSHIIRRVQ